MSGILADYHGEPTDTEAVGKLQDIIGRGLTVCVSTEDDIIAAYQQYYGIDAAEVAALRSGQGEQTEEEEMSVSEIDDFGSIVAEAVDHFEIEVRRGKEAKEQFGASDAPIIKLVNGILIKAVQDGASDIDLEPMKKTCRLLSEGNGSLLSRWTCR